MAPLGPFEPSPTVAVAVSGGADSMACALLADDWARGRGGTIRALVVDHGLRAESAAEMRLTAARLGAAGIAVECLTVSDLTPGPGVAARARAARYGVLSAACAARGIVHLLLGHHAADQAETVAQRRLAGSGPAGLAGMAALTESRMIRLLRPLLGVPPGRLRALLRARGLAWIEDPSNQDPMAQRSRLRLLRADADGVGPATAAAVRAAAWRGLRRAAAERDAACWLARNVRIHPEGFATMRPGAPEAGLSALLRGIAGAAYPPPPALVAAWCADPRTATLAGVRILAGGRLAPDGWLLVREAAAMAPDRACILGVRWDRRFRVLTPPSSGLTIGALGAEAAGLRRLSHLPAAVLVTLPALRQAGRLVAVPHLGHRAACIEVHPELMFEPDAAVCVGEFMPYPAGLGSGGFADTASAPYLV